MKKIGILIAMIYITLMIVYFKTLKQSDNQVYIDTNITNTGAIDQTNIEKVIDFVITNIKNKNLIQLSSMIGNQGLGFSPYGYIDTGKNIVWSKEEWQQNISSNKIFLRGYYDGRGDEINLTFDEYYSGFIYDQDYIHSDQKIVNDTIQHGNVPNNIKEIFPDSYTITYHFNGFDKQYDGMDWKSLTLVFERQNNKRYLIYITHGQRTI